MTTLRGGDVADRDPGVGNMSQAKVCVVCNADCNGKPRVKDPKGRYYCKPCYDRKAAEAAGAPILDLSAPTSPDEAPADGGLADIADVVASARAAPAAQLPLALACPSCGAALEGGAVFCVHCGHDLRTGKASRTRVRTAPRDERETSSGGKSTVPLSGWTLGLGQASILIAFLTVLGDAVNSAIARAGSRPDATWGGVVLTSFIGSSIASAIWYYVGPWWYRVRVEWAGGEADTDAVRSPYFATILPLTIFLLISIVVTMTGHSSPFEYMQADATGWDVAESLISLGLLVGSTIWLFLIVRRAFSVRLVPGLLLLVVLPLAWYIAVTVAIISLMTAVAIANPKAFGDAVGLTPIVSSPKSQTPSDEFPFSFDYPANWTTTFASVDPDEPDAGRELSIDGADGTTLSLVAVADELDIEEVVGDTMEVFRQAGYGVEPLRDLDHLESLRGKGRELLLRSPDGNARATVFLWPVDGGTVVIQAIANDPDELDGLSGLRLIWRTLSFRPPG